MGDMAVKLPSSEIPDFEDLFQSEQDYAQSGPDTRVTDVEYNADEVNINAGNTLHLRIPRWRCEEDEELVDLGKAIVEFLRKRGYDGEISVNFSIQDPSRPFADLMLFGTKPLVTP